MIKDKLIPLGLTFTIIAGAVGCDIANEPVEEPQAVEVEETIESKPRLVNPTKIQSLYLNIEVGMKYDKAKKLWDDEELDSYNYTNRSDHLVMKIGYKKDKRNRYGDKVNYADVYEFTGEYVEIMVTDGEIDSIEYHDVEGGLALDEEMYPAVRGNKGHDWHYFESKEEQINYLKGVIPY